MNQLQYETSPYLLQHAHNPVDWYAWKPEALARAKKENKPILVSIGYSTCHWCHVMERESFEDEAVAAFMNENFINIKVDREERPDLDDIYMAACQIINGNGGWPLNCFLTPDGKPFYAGTYFPPEAGGHGRASWTQILQFTLHNFKDNRAAVDQQAERIMARIARADSVGDVVILEGLDTKKVFTTDLLDKAFEGMKAYFDTEFGGFGNAPKFPDIMKLRYLLNHYYFTKNQAALTHLEHSLDGMIQGGIYDQIGGGLARYATDKEWLAPHFEKMLYDNGLIISLLSDTFALTKKPIYEKAIRQTLIYIQREMTNKKGGFYAALDADSEGIEGKFYVWDKAEIGIILGENSKLFCDFYDISEGGNWEGVNILRRLQTIETFAAAQKQSVAKVEEKLAACRQKLFDIRSLRIRPGRDEKSLLSWNAMMCSGYAAAYAALQENEYKVTAENNIEFILQNMQTEDGHLLRTYSEKDGGQAKYSAYLEDYAYFIKALLDVYEINFDLDLLATAKRFANIVLEEFYDAKDKLFFFTSLQQDDVVMRKKAIYDAEKPCGNSLMAHNFQKLGLLFDNKNYTQKATEMLLAMKKQVEQSASPFANWAAAMQNEVHAINEIAIIGTDAITKAAAINATFIPNKLIMASPNANDKYPLLQNREEGLIYLCKNYACLRPVETVEEVLGMMEEGNKFKI